MVDNDVNWAARHERATRTLAGSRESDEFVYLYLGEGLGCAVVSDGDIRRGRTGLAGEVAHVLTRDGGGTAVTFTQVFEQLGVRRPGTTSLDVDAVLAALARRRQRAIVAHAVAGVIFTAVALCDPAEVVLAGP